MPGSRNKLIQFWHEMKRRRVVHVITVYASSVFIIIELVNNLTEPLYDNPRFIDILEKMNLPLPLD
jgi:hypothetical protein